MSKLRLSNLCDRLEGIAEKLEALSLASHALPPQAVAPPEGGPPVLTPEEEAIEEHRKELYEQKLLEAESLLQRAESGQMTGAELDDWLSRWKDPPRIEAHLG